MIKKVKVGPINYKILYEDNLKDENCEILLGEANHDDGIISINSNIKNDSILKITLLHEILHCIHVNAGERCTKKVEKLVDIFSNGLIDVLSRNENKELIKYLMEKNE